MTEGENKAIEYLKEEIKSLEKAKIEFSNEIEDKGWLQKNINELDNDIFYKNTLLNLIEKLEKENEERSGLYQQAKVELENLRGKTQKYYMLLSKIRKLEDMWNDNIWNATDDESKAKAEMIRDVYRELLNE